MIDMKQGWEIAEFENCLDKVTYTNKIQRKDFKEEGIYPIVSQEKDFINGYWDNEDDLFRVEKPVVIFGDHTQIIKFVDFDFVLGADGVKVLKPQDKIDPKYFYYFLQSIDLGNLGYARHYRLLKEINVAYPKFLPEQQRIVSILDEAFAAIAKAKANAEQNLKNAKELFESYLQGVFEKKGDGWEERKLEEVFDIGSSKRIMEKDWTADGVPFYGGKEIVKLSKFGYAESNSFISEDKYNEYASKYDMPAHGDILITARGTIGIGYIVKMGDKFYYKDGNIISMRAKMPTNPEFILYALKSNAIYNQLRKLTGATVSHLPINKAKKLVLMMPNFSTQNIVVENIKEIEAETQKLEAVYQKKIVGLEELKKSILQKAFSGDLRTEKTDTL